MIAVLEVPMPVDRLEGQLSYLMSRTRRVSLTEGFDPEKSSVQIDLPGDSPFKGIEKAKPMRPLEHVSQGLVFVELELRNYETKRFPAPSLGEAVDKAAAFVLGLEAGEDAE